MQEYPVGTVVADKFRVERALGEGGFSCVYLATQLGMERPVALKIMKIPAHAQDNQSVHEKLVRRFEIEARVISQLSEPTTIVVYDYGESEGGDLYMALEYVRGRSLAEVLSKEGKLEPARVAHIMAQVLRSLSEAHAQGIVHRDIKPANIMLYDHMNERDRVKVLDFGIAKVFSEDQQPMENLTRAGMLVGTPRYMAPELIRGESFGPPADLYALGLLAHELITGVHAVAGETPMAVLSRQIEQRSVSLPAGLALPAGLREVIDRLSAKELSLRFESAQQALDALASARAPAVSASPAQTLDEAPAPLVAVAPPRSGEHAAPGGQRIVAAALAAAILLVAGIVGVGYWSNARSAAPAAAQLTTPAAPPAIKAIEGIDRIADELERSTGALKAPAAASAVEPAAVEPAAVDPAAAEPKPTAAQQLATSGGAGATQGSQKTVAKMARRVEDARGKKPDPRPDPRTPAPADHPAEPEAKPDAPAQPEAPAEPEVKQPPRPVETRIEHIELKYTP